VHNAIAHAGRHRDRGGVEFPARWWLVRDSAPASAELREVVTTLPTAALAAPAPPGLAIVRQVAEHGGEATSPRTPGPRW
jgi:hypothetical protein